jgi:hypothetical protein
MTSESPLIESGPPVGLSQEGEYCDDKPANTRLSLSMMGEYAEIMNALFARNVEPLGGTKASNLICKSRH